MPHSGDAAQKSLYLELLEVLARRREQTAVRAPELAKALGTSPQLVVARLQPLVRAGLVSRLSDATGRTYAINDEGRDYLMRRQRILRFNGTGRAERRP